MKKKLSLTVTKLSCKRNSINIFNPLFFKLYEGPLLIIKGKNGKGKTTLLHVLSTLDFADKNDKSALFLNEIRIADLKQKEISKFRNSQIGFIFQFHELLPEFTALENVCIPGMIRGDKPKELESRAEKLLKTLDLVHIKNQKPSELSGGEQQRVAVARALINEPRILFADEPSGNLDSKSADNLHQLFFDIRDRLKITIVIVTHNKKLACFV